MNDLLATLNSRANAAALTCEGLMRALPGWLSNTLLAAVTAVIMLVIFKYTSNQKAVARVKDRINADILALKLYRDFLPVTLRTQGAMLWGAVQMLVLALIPLCVMSVPVMLLLAQLGLWFEHRPLAPEETTLLTVQLNRPADNDFPDLALTTDPSVQVLIGPHRSNKDPLEVLWKLQPTEPGIFDLNLTADGQEIQKQLICSENEHDLNRVSVQRPTAARVGDMFLHPAEPPFPDDSLIRSISLDYPPRPALLSGAEPILGIPGWLAYFFIASLAFAFALKPVLKVKF